MITETFILAVWVCAIVGIGHGQDWCAPKEQLRTYASMPACLAGMEGFTARLEIPEEKIRYILKCSPWRVRR